MKGTILALVPMALFMSVSVAVAERPFDEQVEERITVIGSLAQARTLTESAVPVDVFSGEQLRATGAVGDELGEALAVLAPSFNFPRQSNSVTSDHVRSAQLRSVAWRHQTVVYGLLFNCAVVSASSVL